MWPAFTVVFRRFAHHEVSTDVEKPCCALSNNSRWSERAGNDDVESTPEFITVGDLLRPAPDHVHPVIDAKCLNSLKQKRRPSVGCIEQKDRGLWPPKRQHKPGHSPTAPEIEHGGR